MEKGKILISSSSALMKSGLSWSLLGLASNLQKQGYEFCLLLPKHGELEQQCQKLGIPYKVVFYYKYGWVDKMKRESMIQKMKGLGKLMINRVALCRIKHIITSEKYDLVHINALTDDICAKAAIATHTKFVWHIREFLEEDLGLHFHSPEKAKIELNHASRVIAVSESVKKKFQPMVKKSILVAYNGIDVERFYRDREIFMSSKITICIAGRVTPQKGQKLVVDAVISLIEKGYNNLYLNVIGTVRDAQYLTSIKENITKSHTENHFAFIDFTTEIENYYQEADIVCVCSSKEAFGRVTVEGMISGALLIGSNSGGTVELIDNGITGFLYENEVMSSLTQAIETAITNPSKSRKIAKYGQKWASENFSVEKNADRIIGIYSEVLNDDN